MYNYYAYTKKEKEQEETKSNYFTIDKINLSKEKKNKVLLKSHENKIKDFVLKMTTNPIIIPKYQDSLFVGNYFPNNLTFRPKTRTHYNSCDYNSNNNDNKISYDLESKDLKEIKSIFFNNTLYNNDKLDKNNVTSNVTNIPNIKMKKRKGVLNFLNSNEEIQSNLNTLNPQFNALNNALTNNKKKRNSSINFLNTNAFPKSNNSNINNINTNDSDSLFKFNTNIINNYLSTSPKHSILKNNLNKQTSIYSVNKTKKVKLVFEEDDKNESENKILNNIRSKRGKSIIIEENKYSCTNINSNNNSNKYNDNDNLPSPISNRLQKPLDLSLNKKNFEFDSNQLIKKTDTLLDLLYNHLVKYFLDVSSIKLIKQVSLPLAKKLTTASKAMEEYYATDATVKNRLSKLLEKFLSSKFFDVLSLGQPELLMQANLFKIMKFLKLNSLEITQIYFDKPIISSDDPRMFEEKTKRELELIELKKLFMSNSIISGNFNNSTSINKNSNKHSKEAGFNNKKSLSVNFNLRKTDDEEEQKKLSMNSDEKSLYMYAKRPKFIRQNKYYTKAFNKNEGFYIRNIVMDSENNIIKEHDYDNDDKEENSFLTDNVSIDKTENLLRNLSESKNNANNNINIANINKRHNSKVIFRKNSNNKLNIDLLNNTKSIYNNFNSKLNNDYYNTEQNEISYNKNIKNKTSKNKAGKLHFTSANSYLIKLKLIEEQKRKRQAEEEAYEAWKTEKLKNKEMKKRNFYEENYNSNSNTEQLVGKLKETLMCKSTNSHSEKMFYKVYKLVDSLHPEIQKEFRKQNPVLVDKPFKLKEKDHYDSVRLDMLKKIIKEDVVMSKFKNENEKLMRLKTTKVNNNSITNFEDKNELDDIVDNNELLNNKDNYEFDNISKRADSITKKGIYNNNVENIIDTSDVDVDNLIFVDGNRYNKNDLTQIIPVVLNKCLSPKNNNWSA